MSGPARLFTHKPARSYVWGTRNSSVGPALERSEVAQALIDIAAVLAWVLVIFVGTLSVCSSFFFLSLFAFPEW